MYHIPRTDVRQVLNIHQNEGLGNFGNDGIIEYQIWCFYPKLRIAGRVGSARVQDRITFEGPLEDPFEAQLMSSLGLIDLVQSELG
jgi:hypothetical protein